MRTIFARRAWEQYLDWQQEDRKILEKINELIRECQRTPFSGTGKPEALRRNLTGWWSRRITDEHRLVYRIDNGDLAIAQCKFHY